MRKQTEAIAGEQENEMQRYRYRKLYLLMIGMSLSVASPASRRPSSTWQRRYHAICTNGVS